MNTNNKCQFSCILAIYRIICLYLNLNLGSLHEILTYMIKTSSDWFRCHAKVIIWVLKRLNFVKMRCPHKNCSIKYWLTDQTPNRNRTFYVIQNFGLQFTSLVHTVTHEHEQEHSSTIAQDRLADVRRRIQAAGPGGTGPGGRHRDGRRLVAVGIDRQMGPPPGLVRRGSVCLTWSRSDDSQECTCICLEFC